MSDVAALSLRSLSRDILEQSILDFLLAPATRLLILLQTQDKSNVSSPDQKTGLWHYLTTIYRQEGISGFWRGNFIESLKNSVFRVLNRVMLRLYEPIFLPKRLEGTKTDTRLREFLLVLAVECTTLLVQHPLKVIRIKLASADVSQDIVTNKRFLGLRRIGACAKKIWDEEGIKGFYKGVSISALQTLSTIALLMLEKSILSSMNPNIETQHHRRRILKDVILSRSPAGMLATYVTRSNTVKQWKTNAQKAAFKMVFSGLSMLILYPYSVLQARVIAGEDEIDAGQKAFNYVEIAKGIWEREGIKGFYRGLSMSVFNTLGSMVLQPVAGTISRKVVNTVIGGEQMEQTSTARPTEGGKRKRRRDKVKKYAAEKTEKLKEKKREVAEKLKKAKEERANNS